MEEIREAAKAFCEAGNEEQKQLARQFFNEVDKNGDGKVSLPEFTDSLREKGFGIMCQSSLFRKLDNDGDGYLDFFDVVALYLLVLNGTPYCDGCGGFAKGLFFSCVECLESESSDSFCVCSGCYRHQTFTHNHPNFIDNILLQSKTGNSSLNAATSDKLNSESEQRGSTLLSKSNAKRFKEAAEEEAGHAVEATLATCCCIL
ncbi:EF-hand domain [Dillenia turbinata]|uniref:EF-hand domain n=1 Tax=Dillenia turbinata TaxID=194707 RepID=A0AAN8YYF5_9MAGN